MADESWEEMVEKIMTDGSWEEMFKSIWKKEGNSFIQFLLDAGLDANALNKFGETMLSYAAEWGNLEVTKFLVQKGADGDVKNSNGSKPLHIAAKYGHKDIVKFFLNKGISADSCDKKNSTPLHYIAKQQITPVSWESYQDIVLFLLESNANLNSVNLKGFTPLITAAKYSNKLIIELLIELGANVDCCDEDQWTILHYSSWNGWLGVVQSLIKGPFNTDLNARATLGDTPIILAAINTHKEIVELLLKSRVNVECSGTLQMALLHHSCSSGWLDIIKFLVNSGCDLNLKDCEGCTPVVLAAAQSYHSVVKYLIDSGANLEGFNEHDRCRVLHYACRKGWLDVVRCTIEIGSDINVQDIWEDTPLHIAVRTLDTEIVKALLEAGADWKLENTYELTAFDECLQHNLFYLEGVAVFIENGAYFQSDDYDVITDTPFLKEGILQNTKMCTQAVINQFNYVDLPKIYKIPVVAEKLPLIENLKITCHHKVANDIEESIKYEIQNKGYCELVNACPIVLSSLCIRSLIKYYDN